MEELLFISQIRFCPGFVWDRVFFNSDMTDSKCIFMYSLLPSSLDSCSLLS